MTPKELRQKAERIAEAARAKLDEIKDDTPAERAAEIEREFDAMMEDHDALVARAERGERLSRAEAAMEEARGRPDPRRPQAPEDRGRASEEAPEGMSYRAAFTELLRNGGDTAMMAPEARQALAAGYRQIEGRTQLAGNQAAGGYTVPEELQAILIRAMAAWGPMYDPGFAFEINTPDGTVMPIPTIDDTAQTAEQGTEGQALTDDGGKDAVFGRKELGAYDFNTEFVRWSWQLNADSVFNFETLLGSLLGERLARKANAMLTTGSGSGEPQGILTAAPVGVTAAGTAAITFDELIDLEHSVDPAYRASPTCAYMFNDTTLSVLRKIKNSQGDYIWQKGDVVKGVPPTLNDHPFRINQSMPNLGAAAKPVIFGDMKKYFVRKVGDPVIGVLRERFWPDLGIAGLIRFDGAIGDARAIKHLANAAS
ncbi:phage major capsid protein [Rhodovulum sp. DZ06]|uniref:phage major capsid protein n=1 Tax=Rhodovulum sp. DZ06 TaxID=3425126 RepID=UPI003D32AF5F